MSERALLIREPAQEWANQAYETLLPGGFVAVFGGFHVALEGEDQGFVVRDCITVVGPVQHQVWLLRRPLDAPTVAQQVLRTGTGGLWVAGCRVESAEQIPTFKTTEGMKYGPHEPGGYRVKTDGTRSDGRWPTNLVLIHAQGCRQVGTQEVHGTGHFPARLSQSKTFGQVRAGTQEERWAGVETVPSWDCQPSGPVPALDAQSGILTTSPGVYRNIGAGGSFLQGSRRPAGTQVSRGDSGGASRFFPQFSNEADLIIWLLKLIRGPQP